MLFLVKENLLLYQEREREKKICFLSVEALEPTKKFMEVKTPTLKKGGRRKVYLVSVERKVTKVACLPPGGPTMICTWQSDVTNGIFLFFFQIRSLFWFFVGSAFLLVYCDVCASDSLAHIEVQSDWPSIPIGQLFHHGGYSLWNPQEPQIPFFSPLSFQCSIFYSFWGGGKKKYKLTPYNNVVSFLSFFKQK